MKVQFPIIIFAPRGGERVLTTPSLNVNSLTMKIDEIRLLIKKENFDILAINEIKIDSKIDDKLIALDDFSLCRYDRSRQGRGVALYVRNTVGLKLGEDLPKKSLEFICIEVEPPKSSPFVVIAWHGPPGVSNICFDNLHENLSYIDGEGDTNCDFSIRDTIPSHIVRLRELYDFFV